MKKVPKIWRSRGKGRESKAKDTLNSTPLKNNNKTPFRSAQALLWNNLLVSLILKFLCKNMTKNYLHAMIFL